MGLRLEVGQALGEDPEFFLFPYSNFSASIAFSPGYGEVGGAQNIFFSYPEMQNLYIRFKGPLRRPIQFYSSTFYE